MSPTPPTFVALNGQLNEAHHRIRELEARETELLAHIRSLCAVITELSHEVDPFAVVELNSRVRSDAALVVQSSSQQTSNKTEGNTC